MKHIQESIIGRRSTTPALRSTDIVVLRDGRHMAAISDDHNLNIISKKPFPVKPDKRRMKSGILFRVSPDSSYPYEIIYLDGYTGDLRWSENPDNDICEIWRADSRYPIPSVGISPNWFEEDSLANHADGITHNNIWTRK